MRSQAKPIKQNDSTSQPASPVSTGQRRRVQARVYADIRQGLMAGAFIPGQVLTLRKFAAAFGTSPMPVREALAQLVAANVLESLPNGSVAVPRPSRERFQDITRVRQALEGLAAADAAQFADSALIDRLTNINQRLLKAIDARNTLQCLATNQEFHFCLYTASRNPVLLPFIESLWLQAGPMMYFSLSSPTWTWDASCHDLILQALRANDARSTRKAVERDIATSAKQVLAAGSFLGEPSAIPHFHFSMR